jgi:Rrf2 family protein
MLVLLAASRDDVLSSTELAERVDSHPAAVRRILADLKAAGLVTVVRGPGGGFQIAREASGIMLDELARAVNLSPAFSMHKPDSGDSTSLDFHIPSAIRTVQSAVTDDVLKTLAGFSVLDVLHAASVRQDLAELVAAGHSDAEIRSRYEISGGRLVRRGE